MRPSTGPHTPDPTLFSLLILTVYFKKKKLKIVGSISFDRHIECFGVNRFLLGKVKNKKEKKSCGIMEFHASMRLLLSPPI